MGCSESVNLANFLDYRLSLEDIKLIKSSWSSVKEKNKFGITLMIKLFQSKTDVKYLWVFASNLHTEEEMFKNSDMNFHGRKIVSTLDSVIEFLSVDPQKADAENKEVFERLILIGKRHLGYGLKSDYYQVFEDCFIGCLIKAINDTSILNERLIIVWRFFIKQILNKFEIGMQRAQLEHKNSHITHLYSHQNKIQHL